MIPNIRSNRILLTLGLLLALAGGAMADTLRLKDGSIIKGRIVGFGNGRFTVLVGEGTRQRELTFTVDEIESIQFDSARPAAVADRQVGNAQNEPRYVETSAPPKPAPRVVTTDNTAASSKPPLPRPSETKPVSPSTETVEPRQPSEPASRVAGKPVELSVRVLADNTSNGWTNSGFVVRKGQRIRINGGSGTISLGKGRTTAPSGLYDLEDPGKLLKNVPTGALIAVIGDDNNEFIYIGSERTFTATRDGALFLGVNEANLDDNKGSFDVKIEIDPA
jgi:hypothetical protein